MKRYVGLEVSQATTAICVVDGEGRPLAERVTATEPCAIAAFVRQRAPDAIRIGMETGPLAVWLWNDLRALDLPVICMDARHANAGLKVMLAKTDHNDAAGIAQLVRTGLRGLLAASFSGIGSKASWPSMVPPGAGQGRGQRCRHCRGWGRAELATRTLLVRMRCDLENQIRGLLKTVGLVVGKAPSRLAKRAHEIVADELTDKPAFASLVESLLAMPADVVERIAERDTKRRARAKTTPVCRRFMTVPRRGLLAAFPPGIG